ncbi:MAG: hypothetical protein WDA75_02895 [Candidatus Latescibacterota bacterium]|jgi:hypothetical protein
MSSINPLNQTLIQTIMAASRPSSLFAASALVNPTTQSDSSQLRGLQGLAAEIGNLAGISRQAQATILGAGRLEAATSRLLPKLRELRDLARQGTAEGLTTAERETLAERFAALQDEINQETGEDLGNGVTLTRAMSQAGAEDGTRTTGVTVTITGRSITTSGVVAEVEQPLAQSQVARDRGLTSITVPDSGARRIVRFTDTGNGQIQATLLEQTDTGLVEIGSQTVAGPSTGAAAEPRVLSFDRLGVTAGLDEGYGAGDLNGLEVTVTTVAQADSEAVTSAASETLLNLSVNDPASAEEAVTRLDQALAGMTSLRTRAQEARAGQRELILQAAQALATAASEQETDSDLTGTVLQATRSLVLQQPVEALSVQGNVFPESAIALLS